MRIESQHKNNQTNNPVKNQIYLKKSQYISLDWFFDVIVQNDSLTVIRICIATIIRHEKPTDDLIQSGFWVIPKITLANLCKRIQDIIIIPVSSDRLN